MADVKESIATIRSVARQFRALGQLDEALGVVETLSNQESSLRESKDKLFAECQALEAKRDGLKAELDALPASITAAVKAGEKEKGREADRILAEFNSKVEAARSQCESDIKAAEAERAKAFEQAKEAQSQVEALLVERNALRDDIDSLKAKAAALAG